MKTRVNKRFDLCGLTRIEVLVVVAVLAVLMAIVLAGLTQAKRKSQRIDCVNNLKQVGLAFRLWPETAPEFVMCTPTNYGGTLEVAGDVWRDFLVMSNELDTPKVLVCPADKERLAASKWSELRNANISYFVGLDADETTPQMLLSGDSNLEADGKPVSSGILNLWTNSPVGWTAARHKRCGNVALADGSVQQADDRNLRELLRKSGAATNRLAIP